MAAHTVMRFTLWQAADLSKLTWINQRQLTMRRYYCFSEFLRWKENAMGGRSVGSQCEQRGENSLGLASSYLAGFAG